MGRRTVARSAGAGTTVSKAPSRLRIFCPGIEGLPAEFAAHLALLPIHDVNSVLLEAVRQPRTTRRDIYAGVLGIDPFRRMEDVLLELRAAGVGGVCNFPSVTFFDGNMKASLDDLEWGFQQEVRLIEAAGNLDFAAAGVVVTEGEARAMLDVGSKILLVPPTSMKLREITAMANASGRTCLLLHARTEGQFAFASSAGQ